MNRNWVRHIIILLTLALLTMAGKAVGQQTDRHFVIKYLDTIWVNPANHEAGIDTLIPHYLTNSLQDATTFGPNCIWYSSNNYNYYFMDGTTKKYLKAPLEKNGTISVGPNPGTQTLNNMTLDYFFYDWDHGLARGLLHLGVDCPAEYNNSGSQCWQAVWVSCVNASSDHQWKMSSTYSYEPTAYSARYLRETETVHEIEVTGTGGAGNLANFSMNFGESKLLGITTTPYSYTITPAYTHYYIEGRVDAEHYTNIPAESYYYYNNQFNVSAPGSNGYDNVTPSNYSWSISCEGDTQYLSFAEDQELLTVSGSDLVAPTLYYNTENTTSSHKMATLTLTVTYGSGASQVMQTRTATVTVKTSCKNPTVLNDEKTITYVGVTVSWTPTADNYQVAWKKHTESNWNNATTATVGNVTSYTITGLEFETEYDYKVSAICNGTVQTGASDYTFTTLAEPGLMVNAIFGGGRMADVNGKTEVVIVNCDSIGAIYGGNDIAGEVKGNSGVDGSTIILGVNSGDATYATYGTTPTDNTGSIRVGSVYGGGNGYYVYDGYAPGVEVGTTVLTDRHFTASVTEVEGGDSYASSGTIPTITKTAIRVTNDKVKVDSIFGGAKNAFLTYNDYHDDGSLITINGGTIMAVFGGNNYGGTQGYGKHHIVVNQTTTDLNHNCIVNSATAGYGRTFGIRYLFGGGNKVYGSTTNVEIFGGQCDTIFAGGNAADVYAANMTVNCAMGNGSGNTWNKVYSNAILSYDGETITPQPNYGWDGYHGIYNVRTLFGGNNMATFDSKLNQTVPTITLTSGSVGTVYGGGNAGDMWGLSNDNGNGASLVINGDIVKYGTHVKMDSPTILIDNLYGGCQVSNVRYSTWVELKNGHVGTVYGGCNVSGDVGSTQINPDAAQFNGPDVPNEDYQKVFGGTYVVASGGTVYKNLFAGGNGYYHCLNTDGTYDTGENSLDYGDPDHLYSGLSSPTHNETHVVVNTGALVKGNVYAGGNLARVGFSNAMVGTNPYPKLVGWSSVRMTGGRVNGNVYGGGNMADVYGSCEVQVSGGTIDKSLYGGNDRTGKVANPASNRVLPSTYHTASDEATSLLNPKVYTYVGLTGNPSITNVYGGGNGDYAYFDNFADAAAYTGPKETVVTCDITNQPIQQCTFVDVGVDGGENGAHIGTVYGGGDGVTVTGFITVFLNVKTNPIGYSNVGTIFGGNNKGDLAIPADIILLNGQVNTVYGGCNQGAMMANGDFTKTIGGYPNIGSYVRLLASYDGDGEGSHAAVTPNVKIMDAVYGGCRLNGVLNNSLVLVEGGDFTNTLLFGGSDISGDVHGDSRVAVVGGTVGNIYGGGNGNYIYTGIENTDTYSVSDGNTSIATGVSGAPTCANSGVDILGGQMGASGNGNAGNAFGGGWGERTRTIDNVEVNIGPATASSWTGLPIIYGNVYGGSALGEVNTGTLANKNTTVNFLNGTLHGNLYGGGLGRKADQANGITAVEAKVYGKVYVNISNSTQAADKCFIDLRDANIFGCNNTNGSPQDDVTVHVYKTAYNYNDYPEGDNYTSQVTPNSYYAIDQVFGGGNQADYRPQAVAEGATSHKTHVWVHDCSNTIRRVFSGGNAAYAEGVETTIEGGRFDYVFGGGNGEVTAANIGAGGTNLLVQAGVVNHLFGGSNSQGNILGPVVTTVSGENYIAAGENVDNPCNENIDEFFGGANLAELGTQYNPVSINTTIECGSGLIGHIYGGCNLADIVGDVTLTIRGGIFSEAYGGSKGRLADNTDPENPITAKAANIDGDVKLNLEGGKIIDAFGGSNINGNITGNITVNVVDFEGDCGLDLTNVYGSGNLTAYTPTNANATSPVVNVIHTGLMDDGTPVGIHGNVYGGGKGASATVTANPIVNIGYNEATMSSYVTGITLPASLNALVSGSVFGGGDAAPVAGNTEVNVYSGEIVQKLVGGGNAADIMHDAENTGNVTINISGGSLCTDTNIDNVGIYGGCNTTGTVGGSVELNITGTAVIGTEANVTAAKKPVNVHGGGYGQGTAVAGNVVVNYGDITAAGSLFPKLFGNLYGGSALGSVNTYGTDNTIVNVLNGSIVSITETVNAGQPNAVTYYYTGNIFGGGLGQKAQGDTIAAVVNGTVHVNIGDATTPPSTGLRGKATLIGCNVYGCNNQNGSPQDNVHVDVYQTAHVNGTNTVDDNDYAILRVFGGGNEAHYAPLGGTTTLEKRTHVYIHGCDNTIKYVYGGGNAADAMGVESIIEGGRFNEVYGGGNGLLTPANIGEGSVGFIILGGHVNFLFEGSNKEGHIGGTPYVPILPQGYIDNCSSLTVDSYYFGDNEAEHIGDIVNTITCDQASQFNYKYVYAGSRWAVVYGDVKLTVQGGNIRYLFGGSKGYLEDHIPADIRRYPSVAEIDTMNHYHPGYYSANLRAHMVAHPELVGTGGNVELIINGGTIGEVIGGCDELGTVDGTITVIVDQIDNQACPLFIGNVYGANNLSDCTSIYTDPDGVSTPKVSIIKGTVGGSATFHYDETNPELAFDGNVFGGGNEGDATSNPKVIVGDGTTGANATPVTIKGDVYGGGNLGDVIGSPKVVVVPERHKLTITPPTDGHGTISVAYTRGEPVHSNDSIGEDVDLRIIATPTEATADGGYLFKKWTVTTAEGASVEARVEDSLSANTLFTMGTGDAILSANFKYVTTKSLTLQSDPSNAGTFKVDGVDHNAGSTMYIPVGATVTVQALHRTGFIFKKWTVTGATLSSTTASVTTFVMADNVTLTAEFESVYTLTLLPNMIPEAGSFTFKVNGANYTGPLSYRQGTTVTVQAKTTEGYAFLRWEVAGSGSSVGNVNAATTSFTMGTANTTLTAVFAPTHTFTFSAGEHGTVTVTDINGHPVQSGAAIGEGATLNILGTPAGEGYIFDEWTLESGTGTIGDSHEASTTFVMGNGNVELTGSFTTAPSDPEEPEDPQEP